MIVGLASLPGPLEMRDLRWCILACIRSPEEIVQAALQEDVDLIGLSSLAGAHNFLLPRVLELLKEKGAEDISLIAGGIFPDEDIISLKQKGVKEIFTPGSTLDGIVKWVRENIRPR